MDKNKLPSLSKKGREFTRVATLVEVVIQPPLSQITPARRLYLLRSFQYKT